MAKRRAEFRRTNPYEAQFAQAQQASGRTLGDLIGPTAMVTRKVAGRYAALLVTLLHDEAGIGTPTWAQVEGSRVATVLRGWVLVQMRNGVEGDLSDVVRIERFDNATTELARYVSPLWVQAIIPQPDTWKLGVLDALGLALERIASEMTTEASLIAEEGLPDPLATIELLRALAFNLPDDIEGAMDPAEGFEQPETDEFDLLADRQGLRVTPAPEIESIGDLESLQRAMGER